ncbi:MAG: NTP transferase domain-containing protein [Dorea sp.]|jgi:dTDP-glucose pyrophosphorylase|nr:NTP transferase domain-containing protein [Dorea sp.]
MLEKYKINIEYSIKEAIEKMDENHGAALLIVDDNDYLLGLFTPGDMRKYILKSNDISKKITAGMNPSPITFETLEQAKKEQKNGNMVVYPIVNNKGKLVDALFRNKKDSEEEKISNVLEQVPLVIMAGGKGKRLYPYTKVLPKALIPIGDCTITERIINQFSRYGCNEVFFILNYKASMIKAYYNDIKKTYKTNYVEEDKFLGTGGGLALLKGEINSTFILSNCDILINDDLECIYLTHKKEKNKITVVCAMKNITVPYGVINATEDGSILKIQEKPEFSFLTNTGVYVIEPEILQEIPQNEYIDFPDIIKRQISEGNKVGIFPISEQSWMDMGQINNMNQMIKNFDIES